jgi:Leucine-rich repeat (LRR) protein
MEDRFLYLSGDCTREEMRLVGTLSIQHLCFCRGRLTEDACQTLPSLSNVESVILWKVKGAGIAAKHVAKMPSLKGLVCVGEGVHDDVFPVFEKLTQLETLGLGSTATVPDLSAVREFDSLKTLTLDDTPVTDISPVADLANLESIALRRTAITDLTPLARLPKLRVLFISDTRVLDVSPIAKASKLKSLFLSQTQTPAQEIAKLGNALPKCEINAF